MKPISPLCQISFKKAQVPWKIELHFLLTKGTKYSLNTSFSKWTSWDVSGHQSVRMCHTSIWIQLHRSLENFLMSSFSLNRIGEVYCRISEIILGNLWVETIFFLTFTTLLFLWLYNDKEEQYIEDAYLCELSYFTVTGSHVV